jgi:hypothetical protein
MPNPFFYGGRINRPEQFVGRKREVQEIFSTLETAHTGQLQSVSVVGPRRIGRSSLLYHLNQVYDKYLKEPNRYVFVYIDLQQAGCNTLSGLLGTIVSAIRKNIGQNQPTANLSLSQFEETIRQLCGTGRNRRYLVVCLDGFERLTDNPEEFTDELYDSWRSLISSGCIAFIVASQTQLDVLSSQKKLTSDFFNVFRLIKLNEFEPEEVKDLLKLGRNCDRPFSDEDCKKIRKLAGRHPLRLQVACSLLYEAKGRGESVNWRALTQEYKRQVAFLLGSKLYRLRIIWGRVRDALALIVKSIPLIGRLAQHTGSGLSYLGDSVTGCFFIVIILLILLTSIGIISREHLEDIIRRLTLRR